MSTLSPEQVEAERRQLMARLAELEMAGKVYAKNPAMMAVIHGRARLIKDRLYELERFGVGGPPHFTPYHAR